jgi:uncharacterized protein with von Willebrand factor type A (vWA) domain
VDDVFDRIEHFTDRFFGGDMRALSRSFSKLAQLTFDQAFQWGAEPEDLARMNEILEKAVDDMRATRKGTRERRRGRRSERSASSGERQTRRSSEAEDGEGKGGREAERAEEE